MSLTHDPWILKGWQYSFIRKKVENGASLSFLAMVSRCLSLLCRAEGFGAWDLWGRALACGIFSLGLRELPNGRVSEVCFREGLCAARQGKQPQSHEVALLPREGRILEHSRASPIPVFCYFLSSFLDEIPAKSLLCGGESVGMLCAYSLDFKILMHKEGLTVRASDGVQPTAFLLNFFYVQCWEILHFSLGFFVSFFSS